MIQATFLEIYNEEVRDLLGRDVKAKLDLKEHTDKGVYVHGLSTHRVARIEVGCFVIRPHRVSILYL